MKKIFVKQLKQALITIK